MSMFSLFCRPKPCRILILLRETDTSWHLSKLAKNSDTTYVYVTKLMSKLQEKGFVEIQVKGKKRIVKLTEKGTAAANLIYELTNKLDDSE